MMLSFDEVLSTTKAVRQRLDLQRPVARELILECCELANYAPSSRNTQPWRFVFVDDADRRARIAELYAAVWDMIAGPMYENELAGCSTEMDRARIERMLRSSRYLRNHLAEVPVILFPLMEERAEALQGAIAQSLKWGSVVPAAWSFMLAARSRGLGTSWTSLHLVKEQEMAEIIGVNHEQYTQLAMIPIGYSIGIGFKKPPRRDVSELVHWNEMVQETKSTNVRMI